MAETISSSQLIKKNPFVRCSWYSPDTGIYSSKHPKSQLPKNPFLDIVSHIFSYPNENNNSALIDSLSGFSIPYSQIFSLVKSISFGLHEMGLSKGDVVLILLPNSIYLPIIYWGVLYLGGIIAAMNPLSSFSEIEKQALSCHAKMAFALCENAHNLSTLGLKKVIQVPIIVGDETEKFADFFRLINNNLGKIVSFPRSRINQDDTAAILCSSGTTGGSKGVVLTHRNLIAMVELFVRFEASQYKQMKSHENVYLAALPMFHIYGLAHFGFGLLTLGTSVVLMRKYDIDEVVKVINKYKVTHFPTVPPLIAALTAKVRSLGGATVTGLCSLKQVSCGAAPITTQVISDFLHTFPSVDFIQGYGMTESTAVGTRGFNEVGDHSINKYTSAGLLAPNMEAKVVHLTTGSCLPPGKAGELLLRGPGVMKGYLNREEATRIAIEEDGWLHTGDIAYFDHDGYLYIIDRMKDMIKYKGFQIAPADLEAILMSHPEVLDVAVIGVAADEVGEIPVAFVIKRPGSLLSTNEVVKYVANMVAPHKKVREVVFVTSFPKSAAGKVLKRQLKKLLPSKL